MLQPLHHLGELPACLRKLVGEKVTQDALFLPGLCRRFWRIYRRVGRDGEQKLYGEGAGGSCTGCFQHAAQDGAL